MPRSIPKWVSGTLLSPSQQRAVLASYIHRYTGEHHPAWVVGELNAKPQYPTDAEWLQHTFFAVTKDYKLDRRVRHCRSHDGWSELAKDLPR